MSSEPKTQAVGRRELVFEADAETLGPQLKRARVGNNDIGTFSLFCDEPEIIGGDNSAPTPLMYFTSALGF